MVHRGKRVVAAALVWVLALTAGPVLADSGTVRGVVLAADGVTPQPGAAVRVASPGTTSSAAAHSGPDGRFELTATPPGTYALLVDVQGSTWLVGAPVTVSGDTPTEVVVRLAPAQSGATTTPATSAKQLPTWAEWLIAGGIVVAGTLLVLEVNDQDESSASPF